MNIESIDYSLLIDSFLCILLGMFICWIYMKKSVLVQLTEKETIQETFNILQNKYEILQLEKMRGEYIGLNLIIQEKNLCETKL